jgi:hypothetical protein
MKKGGKKFVQSYGGGPPIRVGAANPQLGRGNVPNDARATMVGDTVQVNKTLPPKANGQPAQTPRPPKV